MKQYLEAGKIINTHGIRGEVKVDSWCDSPEALAEFETVYIDHKPQPSSLRVSTKTSC